MIQPRLLTATFLCLSLAILAGCSSTNKTGSRGGGYYKDDGPGSNIPANIEAIPNAVPRIETHAPANFRPYVVFGKKYVPVSDERPFQQRGTASWYGRKFHGKKTANGETYDMYAMSAAHPTLPIPSYARVTRAGTGKWVIVRVNDRGPFHSERVIDLSYAAAAKLGIVGPGSGQVIVEAITNDDIRNKRYSSPEISPIGPAAPTEKPTIIIAQAPQPVPDALEVLQAQEPDYQSSLTSTQPVIGATAIYLQFGAFSAQHTATGLAQKLNRQISEVESRPAQVDPANNLYRVRIGPYPSRTDAVNASLRIQQATGLQPAVAIR
ncbi:septal ring lytic transglycosylase RlpA family protein [Alcaligenaceae bacterium]|nr:septal ring lytic transglycosylase RlpA family protein [Alcaligenaceae bacterium]